MTDMGDANAGPRRYEDFMDGAGATSVSEGDDTFSAAVMRKRRKTTEQGEGAETAAAGASRGTRAPRKTFNEEADASGFVFSVEPRRNAPSASTSSSAAAPSASSMGPPGRPASKGRPKSVKEPLPSDALGETPINRRNQLFRGGPAYPSTPAGGPRGGRNTSSSSRRSSLNLKTSRRSSSLRDGTTAYPHPSVPDQDLYRHCADNLPPVMRMKHMSEWTLERAKHKVLASLPSASGAIAKRGQKEEPSQGSDSWSSQDLKTLSRCRPSIAAVMDKTLQALSAQQIDISWMRKVDSKAESRPIRNPENEENRKVAEKLRKDVENLDAEKRGWEAETAQIEGYEAQTAALVAAGASSSSAAGVAAKVGSLASADVTAPPPLQHEGQGDDLGWALDDVDAVTAQMLKDAQRALASEENWIPTRETISSAETEALELAVRAAAATRRRETATSANGKRGKRKSEAPSSSTDEEDAKLLEGSELDPRWTDFEFLTDLLHSYTHTSDRLNLFSSSYTSATSSRAAQSLRQLVYSGDVGLGSSTSDPSSSASTATASSGNIEERRLNRERKERLLGGIRESIGSVRRLELEAHLRNLAEGDATAAQVVLAGEAANAEEAAAAAAADQSHFDLFRALARGKPTSSSGSGSGSGGRKSRGGNVGNTSIGNITNTGAADLTASRLAPSSSTQQQPSSQQQQQQQQQGNVGRARAGRKSRR